MMVTLNRLWDTAVVLALLGLLCVVLSSVCFALTRFVFLHGPTALGFWEGASQADICARMTQTAADLWVASSAANAAACETLIARKTISLMLSCTLVFLVLLSYQIFHFFSCGIMCYYWRRNNQQGWEPSHRQMMTPRVVQGTLEESPLIKSPPPWVPAHMMLHSAGDNPPSS